MADEENQNDNENFERLLSWLDPDQDEAWKKYDDIRERLIKIFTWRKCTDVEGLADEVMDRVEQKVAEVSKTYTGDPARYFYGVAQHVAQETIRNQAKFLEFTEKNGGMFAPDDLEKSADAIADDALDYCLGQLSEADRQIILAYYQYGQQTKKADHRQLAEELGMTKNALWIRVSRIRSSLAKCLKERLKQGGQAQ